MIALEKNIKIRKKKDNMEFYLDQHTSTQVTLICT